MRFAALIGSTFLCLLLLNTACAPRESPAPPDAISVLIIPTPTATATSTPITPTATPVTPTLTPTPSPTPSPSLTPTPSNTPTATPRVSTNAVGSVLRLVLVNADTDRDITVLGNSSVINYSQIGTHNLNVRADVDSTRIQSVDFYLDGNHFWVENSRPYAMGQDQNGNYKPWTPPLGNHTIMAVPFSQDNARGNKGVALTITINVVER